MPQTKPNPLRVDPSRTTTLRNNYIREYMRRIRSVETAVRHLIVTEDAFGLRTSPPVFNQRWAFETKQRKIANFTEWLREQLDERLLGTVGLPAGGQVAWTAEFIREAYDRGASRALRDTNARRRRRRRGRELGFSAEQFRELGFAAGPTSEQLEALFTRSFSALQGISSDMDTRISRALADGLLQGRSPEQIARRISEQTGLTRNRARTLARTEIIHSFAEAQLDSFERLGVEEIGVMAEWQTARDDRVCPLCRPLEGVVMKVEEARGLIPRHPNCRCIWVPILPEDVTKDNKFTKREVTQAVGQSARAETRAKSNRVARRLSQWEGADVEPTQRPSRRARRRRQ